MGSVYKRGRTWWLKYKDATGEWTPDATKAVTKAEARALLQRVCGLRTRSLAAWYILGTVGRRTKERGRNPSRFGNDSGLMGGGV
jgi:hypothetical protein